MWSTVLAYAQLVSSNPRNGALLDRPPARITLVFSESLDGEQSSFTVMDARGHIHGLGQIDLGDLDRKTLSGKLDEHADSGLYTGFFAYPPCAL
jgi:methionine-rich copper-binding protein CopC